MIGFGRAVGTHYSRLISVYIKAPPPLTFACLHCKFAINRTSYLEQLGKNCLFQQHAVENYIYHPPVALTDVHDHSLSFLVLNMSPPVNPRKTETFDLFLFTTKNNVNTTTQSERLIAACTLVGALHTLDFVKIKGHGLTEQEVAEVFT